VDEELKQLDLATAEARRLATAALEALRLPQEALRSAATAYIESAASRRLDASRRVSVEVIAKLSDDDLAELRLWTSKQIDDAREAVEREIESCDFWIPDVAGLSPTDVSAYSGGLVPRPKDTRTGIPQTLVQVFDACLAPLRRGLAAIDLTLVPADAAPSAEVALVRAWHVYRDAAVVCVSRWADVDEHYHASAERFQEMRWELAGEVDPEHLEAKQKLDHPEASEPSIAHEAEAAATAPPDAVARMDTETLVPVSG
jgi:hypothetical protein